MAPRTRGTTGNKQSARDVLEKIALQIYKEENEKTIPYESQLIGILTQARFSDGYSSYFNDVRYGPGDSCGLDHIYYTNIIHVHNDGRNPCHDRDKNRFDENAEAYCNNDKIRVIGNNRNDGTACVPFRRQNLCDRNLEYLINKNTNTTHDLLGNVLVTAKYEGASIVEKHPHKNNSEVCTALARSFADIGDIVRGRDMFKSNDNVEKGLKVVFGKINNGLKKIGINAYDDGSENYYKLREAWWKANRDQVWKAITCKAPNGANYFRKNSDGSRDFTSIGKCGHNKGSVPTYLDYVPQFLRWYDEWSEEFCRIRNHKLQKVKDTCQGYNDNGHKIYCSGDGEDCEKIVRQDYNIRSDFLCPSCKNECTNYKKWIDKKQGEFNKQKKKYEKEIKKVESNSDSTYDKKVYEALKERYRLHSNFVATLKEAPYCNNNNVGGTIDFNKPEVTFSSSTYCASCPVFGVICKNGECTEVNEDEWCKMKGIVSQNIKNKEGPINVDVLVTDDKVNELSNDLKDSCDNSGIFKGIRKDQRSCKYLCDLDVCDLNNTNNNKHIEKRISIRVLFKRWLEYFFKDYSKLKKKLYSCTNNGKESICINECKKKCECVGKWAEEKRKEWEKVRKRYFSQYNVDDSQKSYTVKSIVNGNVDRSDIKNSLDESEDIETLKESDTCYNSDSAKKQKCEEKDVITILIDRLKNKINDCKTQHDNRTNQYCCDELPESKEDDEDEEEEGGKKKNSKQLEVTKEEKEKDDKKFLDLCEEVKKYIEDNNTQKSIQHKCNKKEDGNWNDSTKKIDIQHTGAHMPPRRKSLCIRELRYLAENREKKSINDYKNAFTKCASIETYLLWQKYKTSNGTEDKLKGGEIPEDFRRIMYYTYGDYRDIFLGTDISSDGNIKNISQKVKALIEGNTSKTTDRKGENHNSNLQSSWEEHKRDIWKGMLCGLTYGISNEQQKNDIRKMLNNKYNYPCDLETFSKKPQFLRWFMEWAEDYCRNYKKQLDILQKACSEVDCKVKDKQKKKECKTACENFNKFVNIWKDQYRKQKQKYENEKADVKKHPEYNDYVNKEAYEYLKDKCLGRKCECIQKVSEVTNNKIENIPSGFDTPPKDYVNQCSCAPNESACDNDELPKGRSEHQMECEDLNNNGDSDRNTMHESKKKDLVGEHSRLQIVNFKPMYFPPRVKQLCLKNIEKLTDSVNESKFVKVLQKDAYNEAKQLYKYYEKDGNDFIYTTDTKETDKDIRKHTIENMKRSYADYADLVKGKTKYNLYDKYNHINNIIERVVVSDSSTSGKEKKREKLWEKYRADVWNAMLCGYKEASKSVKMEQNACELPKTEETDQFIRWFTEWAENFCIYKKREVAKMEESCNFTDCKTASDDIKTKCHALCKKYKNWIEEKQNQYKNQKKIYEHNYKAINNNNKDAHEFLKDECKNRCNCISNNTSGDNKDNVFQEYPEDSKEACKCPPVPGSSNKGSPFGDIFNIKNVIKKRPCPKNDSTDINRHSEENEYGTKSKNSTLPHMSCVEKAAYKMKEFDEKNIQDIYGKLKGDGLKVKSDCNLVDKTIIQKDGFKEIDKEELKKIFPSNEYSCENENIKRFEIEQKWNCNNINRKQVNICLPPRRQHICIKRIKEMSSRDIISKDDLLKEVMEAAKEEGIDILKKLKTEKSTQFYKICDAMKYSFADIGDIIRGRDLWNKNPSQKRIQTRLGNIFRNIYDALDQTEQKKYMNPPNNYKLREAWWNANRKEIWKAMTCVAPENAYFRKTEADGIGISSLILPYSKCGRDSDPPIVDYIPQRFRWMQEWSEYFCKAMNKNLDDMKVQCDKCTSGICTNDTDGKFCMACKEKCKYYNDFIKQWKSELEIQSTKYRELYEKANTNDNAKNTSSKDNTVAGSRSKRGRHIHTIVDDDDNRSIEFLKLVKNKCEDPNNADKYLDKIANCPKIKFTKNGDAAGTPPISASGTSTGDDRNYAFENPPKDYKDSCNCKAPEPLDKCPDGNSNTYNDVCKTLSATKACTSTNFNNNYDYWTAHDVQESTEKNKGVLVPPRRRKLCIRNITPHSKNIDNKGNFKTKFLQYAYTQGHYLSNIYKHDKENAIDAMRYSFYDYGDIVKGTDIMENVKNMKDELNRLLNENGDTGISDSSKNWWDENKRHIWNAMLCGYQKGKNNTHSEKLDEAWCDLHMEGDIPQFLRWFKEWTESFCTGRNELYKQVQSICELTKCNTEVGTIESVNCETACETYRNYITRKKNEYLSLKSHYDMNYKESKEQNKEAHEYIKNKCSNSKCQCLSKHTNNENNWKEPYDTFDNNQLKDICDCKKIEKTIPAEATEAEEKGPPSSHETLPPYPLPNDQPDDTGDYGMPTLESKNRYIPYRSGTYKGKTYIYMEGDSDSGHYYEDTTDVTSSESEYEELDINDIYVPGSPKYKTLIEVVLEPSKSNGNTPSKGDGNTLGDDMVPTTNTFTDEEWNELKQDFISQYLPNTEPNNNYRSGNSPTNTNNTTTSHDNMGEKPFIMSIHDRNLYTGEEISYNINMSTNTNNDIPKYVSNNVYSGIDLINDTLSGNKHIDIYDEVLKRKENELFGTNHVKQTSIHSVAKNTYSDDAITNKINLFHKWLDRHRDMCEKWENHHERLAKLKEKWENDNDGGNVPSDNHVLNTDVSIEIDMDNPKPKNEFTNMDTYSYNSTMDTILDDMEDDIYYDVNDENPSVNDIPMDHNKVDVPKKVHVEMKILNNTSTGSLEPEFPISDVWNI
ncbi:erythrocyte membrane protein 1 [Plasmodium falciparum IGH-CR14]|uniref:Erythrocyte membrane protein 1 n=1 Tax=Plasmodium falciparum IGH-CR14 TaxID=580059 RepID=A0A0L1I5L6_PLAFA|nr:erythrocyte membrane protein 1 [Plasmodium falciparum IGH-CR14]